ncbi:MAG: Hpt domain-containing protein [Lachnospiraceae bacterium]|nr:Hpt domain-containing protein [Lachnospiraceae bacterium]
MGDMLPQVEGLDIEKAINNTGMSYEDYLDILKTYYLTLDKKIDDIIQTFSDNDIENYTIHVHALKSSSRVIGAYELGDDAYELELCGKSSDIETIKAKTPALVQKCQQLKDTISAILPEQDITGTIDLESLLFILDDIRNYMADNDILLINDTLEQLEGVYYDEETNSLINTIKDLALEMEYAHAISLIDEFININS